MDEGGKRGNSRWERSILTKTQVEEIYNLLLNTSLSQTEIGQKFNVSQIYISRINMGNKFYNPQFSYPIRPDSRKIDQQKLEKTILNNLQLTNQEIADICQVSLSSVKRAKTKLINSGKINKKIK